MSIGKLAASFAVCVCAIGWNAAAEPRWPVVSLAYDGTVGSTETDEEVLEDTAYRHQVAVRVREEWSRDLITTLVGDLIRKVYVSGSGSSYSAFQISPELRWSVLEGLRWDTSMLVRRALYDEPYASGESRDFTRLGIGTGLALGLVKGLTLAPRLQATLELYDDAARSRQSYGLGVSLDARLGRWNLGADYRGSLRMPLGALNVTTTTRLEHAFGADLTWDPNR